MPPTSRGLHSDDAARADDDILKGSSSYGVIVAVPEANVTVMVRHRVTMLSRGVAPLAVLRSRIQQDAEGAMYLDSYCQQCGDGSHEEVRRIARPIGCDRRHLIRRRIPCWALRVRADCTHCATIARTHRCTRLRAVLVYLSSNRRNGFTLTCAAAAAV